MAFMPIHEVLIESYLNMQELSFQMLSDWYVNSVSKGRWHNSMEREFTLPLMNSKGVDQSSALGFNSKSTLRILTIPF
jgi:hypothetical protein